MASYRIAVSSRGWAGLADQILERLGHVDDLIDSLADDVVLPMLARHYYDSGLKTKTGDLLRAVSQRGAKGNTFRKTATGFITGVDYMVIPYAQAIIEGARPHDIPNAFGRGHTFGIGGRFQGKFHPGNAAHAIFYLSPAELIEVEKALMKRLKAKS